MNHTPRLIILNTCWAALVVWASVLGYTQFVFNGDGSYVSYLIAGILTASVTATATGRNGRIQDAAAACTALGFLGTLVGITLGMSGVDLSALGSSDGVIQAGTSLFSGMATAFCSTITGAIAAFWLCTVGMVVGVRAW